MLRKRGREYFGALLGSIGRGRVRHCACGEAQTQREENFSTRQRKRREEQRELTDEERREECTLNSNALLCSGLCYRALLLQRRWGGRIDTNRRREKVRSSRLCLCVFSSPSPLSLSLTSQHRPRPPTKAAPRLSVSVSSCPSC